MADDEYAIVSKKEFLALKKEIDRLKKDPLGESEQGENLQGSIENLSRSLNTMLEVFKQAAQEMNLEEHDTQLVSKQIGPINEKIDNLIDQNQKIAKGLVAVADMVKEKLDALSSKPVVAEKTLPPLSGGPAPIAPPPGPMPPGQAPMPPPMGAQPPTGMPPPMGAAGTPPPLDADLPPLGGPSSLPPMPPPMGMPPPPGSDKKIVGGLMK